MDERVGHYLATWALSCPLAQRQFNNAVQYVNTATSTQTTGEACKAAVEAYNASFLSPTVCELVLNMRAPKSPWRTLSELCTLRKLECHCVVPGGPYSRPICTERDFQARWKQLVASVQLDARCHGVAQGHRDLMALRLMGHIHPLPAGLGAVNQPQLSIDVHRPGDAYPLAGGNRTQLTISLANFDRLARSPAGLWVLSMANCDDKAMDTLGTLWKSNWEVGLSPSAFHLF